MEESEKTDLALPVTVRNGSQTLMRIPFDAEYTLKIKKGKNSILAYTDLIDCHEKTTPEEGEVYFTKLGQEDYYYELVPGETHTSLTGPDGDEITAISTSYEYLPSNAMEGELSSLDSRYLTLRSAIKVLVGVLCLLLIVFIVSIVIFFLDRKKRRQGQPPFPEGYVIVPHLIYVFTFICLTYFVEIHLYSIPVLRAFCAAAAMVTVFFLAGRAFLRHKNIMTGLIAVITLAVTVWLYLNYSAAPFSKNLFINFMVLVLGVLVLTILTVIGYLKGRLRNR